MSKTRKYLSINEFTKLLKTQGENSKFVTGIKGPSKPSVGIDQNRIEFNLNFPNGDELKFHMLLQEQDDTFLVKRITGKSSNESYYETVINTDDHKNALVEYFTKVCGETRLKFVTRGSEIK